MGKKKVGGKKGKKDKAPKVDPAKEKVGTPSLCFSELASVADLAQRLHLGTDNARELTSTSNMQTTAGQADRGLDGVLQKAKPIVARRLAQAGGKMRISDFCNEDLFPSPGVDGPKLKWKAFMTHPGHTHRLDKESKKVKKVFPKMGFKIVGDTLQEGSGVGDQAELPQSAAVTATRTAAMGAVGTSARSPDQNNDALQYFDEADSFEPESGNKAGHSDPEADRDSGYAEKNVAAAMPGFFFGTHDQDRRKKEKPKRAPLVEWKVAISKSGPREYGLLGEVFDVRDFSTERMADASDGGGDEEDASHPGHGSCHLALNVSEPFCLIAVGVQGSGKSHSIGTVIENCTVPAPGIVNIKVPMPTLVLHYDDSAVNPCEVASVALPAVRLAKWLKGTDKLDGETFKTVFDRKKDDDPKLPAAKRVVILASPSYIKQMTEKYRRMPRTDVRPLIFSWAKMTAKHLKVLMGVQPGDCQLYVSVFLQLLRDYQANDHLPDFDDFKNQLLTKLEKSPGQCSPLEQRFALLEPFLAESEFNKKRHSADVPRDPISLEEITEAGTVIIADLTDPLLDPGAANGLFQVLLEQFRDIPLTGPFEAGKLCVLDEAHKYMSGDKAKSGMLSASVVETVRQMRHYGQRIAISTQSPLTLPPEVLELSSIVLCHNFHSRDWYDYLRKKIPMPEDGFEIAQSLEEGEALVYGKMVSLETCIGSTTESMFCMKVRKRLTADGGASRTLKR